MEDQTKTVTTKLEEISKKLNKLTEFDERLKKLENPISKTKDMKQVSSFCLVCIAFEYLEFQTKIKGVI